MAEFGMSVDEALKVSDHLPVWAEFSVRESTVVGPVWPPRITVGVLSGQ
jgi:hypothetical protein